MELLHKYVNLQCTAEEKQLVYEYLEADFCRCFELIKLMKIRAYNELQPKGLLVEKKLDPCIMIDRQMNQAESKELTLKRRKKSTFGWLYNFFTNKDKEDLFEELADDSVDEKDEDLLSASLNEVVSDLISEDVSSVREPDLVYGASPASLFTASGFLGLLEDYIDSPD